MDEGVFAENIHLEEVISRDGLYYYLQKIKEDEEREKNERSKKNGKDKEVKEDQGKGIQDESDTEMNKPSLADKLLEALDKNDALEVWELVENNQAALKTRTLESLDNKEKRNCSGLFCCGCFSCGCFRCCGRCKDSCADEQQNNKQQRESNEQQNNKKSNNEEKRKWIKILSNPLFISVEWLWRTKGRKEDSKGNSSRDSNNRNDDVIEDALNNACLLEEIASHEHHYSREEYKSASEACENFAVDVLEKITSSERYEDQIMDIRGNGCLLTGKPKNFIQSLSLLKIAADKGRKKFVASPRSQFVLNEIIYYQWEDWQDKSWVLKCLCEINWCIESLYEHPYSKLINHTMSYIVFVGLLFAATFGFEDEYGSSTTGLSRVDWAVVVFVAGLIMQEFWEVRKQGIRLYFSKWWNVVDALTLITFFVSYVVWCVPWWFIYGEWQPRSNIFIIADVLYASATVMAYFHLAHFFQVNSTLGPLQLSLYRMLKDVLKFLLVFFMLYFAFASGVVKVYSYYVAAQIKIGDQNNSSHYQDSHPYAEHENTFIGLFWMLVGYIDEDKIMVDDPAFNLTSSFACLFLVAYSVCTTIVALNMLIAMMNSSFNRVMDDADTEWKFSRAQMWLEWIDKGNAIPVPFNTIYYAIYVPFMCFFLLYWIFTGCHKEKWPFCNTSPQGSRSNQTDSEQGRENQACTSVEADAEEGRVNQNGSTTAKTDTGQGRKNQERMDAMTYLVARYLNERHLAEQFKGKSNFLTSLMNSKADARTGEVNVENTVD
ncbi:hypothetical protein ACROYT_G003039 [Oculina patagonica]